MFMLHYLSNKINELSVPQSDRTRKSLDYKLHLIHFNMDKGHGNIALLQCFAT